ANLTGSTVCLVTGQPVHVQKTPLINRLSRRAHAEALAVAAAHGVVLNDHPDARYGPKRVYTSHRTPTPPGRWRPNRSCARRSPSPAAPASTRRRWMPSKRSASPWPMPRGSTRRDRAPSHSSPVLRGRVGGGEATLETHEIKRSETCRDLD